MPEQKTVLLTEDNERLNEINRRALERAGYRVVTARCLAEAREHIGREEPDAILLDIMLPDGSGADFCREIRGRISAPILFLTSINGYEQTLKGLEAGGDDYLNKPYNLDILLAKVGAFLRRDEIISRVRQPGERLVRGALTLDIVASRAYVDGTDILLSPKEFDLLLFFIRREGELLSFDEIYESVWNQPMVHNSNTLKIAVSRLRNKLEGSGYEIVTKRGEGYRLKSAL